MNKPYLDRNKLVLDNESSVYVYDWACRQFWGARQRQSYLRVIAALCAVGLVVATAPVGAEPVRTDDLLNAGSNTRDWLHYGRTYDGHRYVRLDQINRSNVHRLRPVWIFPAGGANRGLEATPLIHDGIVYVSADESRVFAIEARSGAMLWSYDPEVPDDAERIYCCDAPNRGVALWDDKVLVGTMDARVVAIHKNTGAVVWDTPVADWQTGYSVTGAPLVVKDMVLTGVAGGEYGIRGFVKALDVATGAERWTTFTIPGPGVPGHDTWPGDTWRHGGGATWTTGAYDPELDLVYWQVGNPAPWNCRLRPGDNKWTAGTIALDADSGAIRWGFQYTPGDCWDYDAASSPVLADLTIRGAPRKALLHYDKNGFFYALDRADGRFIYAVPVVPGINWTRGLDPTTGRPIKNPEFVGQTGGKEVAPVIPGLDGGIDWQPLAYNPDNGTVFFLSNSWASGFRYHETCSPPGDTGTRYVCADFQPYRRPDVPTGAFVALEVATGAQKWRVVSDQPFWAGAVATSSGLVFTGDTHGHALALDTDSGAVLWRFPTGAPISGSPITYALEGTQYVLFPSGMAGILTYLYREPRAANLIAFALDGGMVAPDTKSSNLQPIPGVLVDVGTPGIFLDGRVIEGYGYPSRE